MEGDEFIPIVEGIGETSGKLNYPAAAIYKLRSNGMKGNVVCSSVHFDVHYNRITERDQAAMIPQAHLAAFYAGVKKMFWYEFRDDDTTGGNAYNAESCFGMVHKNLSEKMGYKAYQTMIRARPRDSVQDTELPYEQGDYVVFHWKRSDGLDGWALWSFYPVEVTLNMTKRNIKESFGMYGENYNYKYGDTVTLTNDVLYIIGSDIEESTPESNSALVIGLSVSGGVLALAAIVVVAIVLYRRSRKSDASGDAASL